MQKLPYACFPIILTSSERCSKDIWQKWQLVWMLFILGKFESDIPCQHKAKLSVFMVCTILKTSWILEVVLKIWSPWIRLRSLKSTYFLYYSLGVEKALKSKNNVINHGWRNKNQRWLSIDCFYRPEVQKGITEWRFNE